MYLYFLEHIRYFDYNCFSNQKNLGVYTSLDGVDEAIARYSKLEGFINHPNGYAIHRWFCKDYNTEKSKIGLLQHYIPYEDDYYEKTEFLGIFSTYKEALKQQGKYAIKYVNYYPDNFYVGEYLIDEDNKFWAEGFIDD